MNKLKTIADVLTKIKALEIKKDREQQCLDRLNNTTWKGVLVSESVDFGMLMFTPQPHIELSSDLTKTVVTEVTNIYTSNIATYERLIAEQTARLTVDGVK